MRSEIRGVALALMQKERVAAAARSLSAHAIQARLSDWDGTRCDLVVANADDGYGRHVIEIARRRGLAVVALSADLGAECRAQSCVDATASEATLADEMLRVLRPDGHEVEPPVPQGESRVALGRVAALTPPALLDALPCKLALDPAWAGQDVLCRLDHRHVYLLPSRGRVLTATMSEQLSVRDHLCEPGWSMRRLEAGEVERAGAEVSTGLDAFLLRGVLRGVDKLPLFPRRTCVLEDWPDLGSASDVTAALKVAGALSRGAIDSAALPALADVDPRQVSACLWAFAASGLLKRADVGSAVVPRALSAVPARGLFAKLARHFGLARVSV